MDFVEICNVCTKWVIIKDAKRIFNSDKICGSYCDFYFGVTFFWNTLYYWPCEQSRERLVGRTTSSGNAAFMPPPPAIGGERHHVFGRPFRPSVLLLTLLHRVFHSVIIFAQFPYCRLRARRVFRSLEYRTNRTYVGDVTTFALHSG